MPAPRCCLGGSHHDCCRELASLCVSLCLFKPRLHLLQEQVDVVCLLTSMTTEADCECKRYNRNWICARILSWQVEPFTRQRLSTLYAANMRLVCQHLHCIRLSHKPGHAKHCAMTAGKLFNHLDLAGALMRPQPCSTLPMCCLPWSTHTARTCHTNLFRH